MIETIEPIKKEHCGEDKEKAITNENKQKTKLSFI